MKERPILFSAPMVRAILEGRKTQTRRVVKPQPQGDDGPYERAFAPGVGSLRGEFAFRGTGQWEVLRCPYGRSGSNLWVRESIIQRGHWDSGFDLDEPEFIWHEKGPVEYAADGAKPRILKPGYISSPEMRSRPSIHMPRWASRITLEITEVRVERLQDISEEDARAEGIETAGPDHFMPWRHYGNPKDACLSAISSFNTLWDSINGQRQGFDWASNPWVWVVNYKRVKP